MRKQALICSLLLGGCSHAGHGSGELVEPATTAGAEPTRDGTVAIEWHSGSDDTHGTLRAVLPGARTFTGEYLQLRAEVDTDSEGPHIAPRELPEWARDPWYGGAPHFHQSGSSNKVVALLRSADGVQMRCRFELTNAEAGIRDGGRGDCQLSDDEQIVGATLVPDGAATRH